MIQGSTSFNSGPRWMVWAVVVCLAVFLLVGLSTDLNGNIVITPNGPFPDLLSPAPAMIMLLALGAGTAIALAHAVRYAAHRFLWLAILLFFVIASVATILPAL